MCIFLHISLILQENTYLYLFVHILHILTVYLNLKITKMSTVVKKKKNIVLIFNCLFLNIQFAAHYNSHVGKLMYSLKM